MEITTRGILGTGLTATLYTVHSLVITSQGEVAITVEWEIHDKFGRHQLIAEVVVIGPGYDDARVLAVKVDGRPVANAVDATQRQLADRYDE